LILQREEAEEIAKGEEEGNVKVIEINYKKEATILNNLFIMNA